MLRRLAPAVVLALVAGLALSGCQTTSSSVAVQIGDFRVTNAEVDHIVDLMDQQLLAVRQSQAAPDPGTNGASPSPTAPAEGLGKATIGGWRTTIVQFMVFNEVARRMLADLNITVPKPDYAAAAEQIPLHADNPYIALAVDSDSYRSALLQNAKAVPPTNADLHAAYDKVVAAGAQVGTFEETLADLQGLNLGQGLGLRASMAEALTKYGVVVNPRYLPLELPLIAVGNGGSIVLVSLPVGAPASPAVRDLPAPATAGV